MKTQLLSLSQGELKELLVGLGEPQFRAKQIYEWLLRGAQSFDDMLNIPKTLREKLAKVSEGTLRSQRLKRATDLMELAQKISLNQQKKKQTRKHLKRKENKMARTIGTASYDLSSI